MIYCLFNNIHFIHCIVVVFYIYCIVAVVYYVRCFFMSIIIVTFMGRRCVKQLKMYLFERFHIQPSSNGMWICEMYKNVNVDHERTGSRRTFRFHTDFYQATVRLLSTRTLMAVLTSPFLFPNALLIHGTNGTITKLTLSFSTSALFGTAAKRT